MRALGLVVLLATACAHAPPALLDRAVLPAGSGGISLRERVVESCEGQVCYLRCSGKQTLYGTFQVSGGINLTGTTTSNAITSYTTAASATATTPAILLTTSGALDATDLVVGITGLSGTNGFTYGGKLVVTNDISGNASSDVVGFRGLVGSTRVVVVTDSTTAPTISSGFGTSPSISATNGTAAFTVTIGTGGVGVNGVIALPTATTGWVCSCQNLGTASTTVFMTRQTASTTTSCTVGNFNSSNVAAAWGAGDVLHCLARGR